MRKLLLAIVLACAAPAAASADLIVVDAAGGGDFTDLPAAIDAAQPGDLLLLRPGSYSGHGFMNSKPLDIVADGPDGSVRVVSLWRIFNLTAGESLVIRGLAFDEAPFELSNSVGPVRVEDCSFDGKDQAPLFPNGWPAASLLNCSAVSFVRCADVRGGDGSDGNLGLWIRESQFALLSTAVHGGRGVSYGAEQHGAGGDGGPAVALFDGSSLVAVGGSITGGEGGSGGVLFDPPFAYPGGDGGIGLLLDSPADAATLREVTLAGGAGGFSLSRPGLPGDPLSAPPGTVALDPETSRHFQCSSVVRPGQSVSLAFGGQPGETVLLFVSGDAGYLHLPKFGAPYLLGSIGGDARFILGALDPTGALQITAPWDGTGLPVEALALHLQPAFLGSSEGPTLGPAALLVLLQPGV